MIAKLPHLFGGMRMRTLAMEVRLIKGLDNEWVQLMKEAREAGISKDEIREFLAASKVTE
ncbi:anti-repressor SinI family protein [Alkalibacillus haloalkaliphilus]|uniref:Sin domain-containing protein n=1 Tax=Alkalibacillus haloalkaliphilus TaxID=94136 RepID=A0A511W649_9BACI|nr:anti-repressor SinI family protein [Alkalibacillus haloalkaliphilus]GEN46569.1 hypothetical protein AHA02nite_23450 [Alkalibacillus haloalkaliphilus]